MKAIRAMGLLLAIGAAVEGRAQLIAYDSFSGYSAGTLNGQGQGYGWTNNWSTAGGFTAVPGSDLAYTGLTGATGLASASGSGVSITRTFPAVSSGTIYFGALVQYSSATQSIRLINLVGTENTTNTFGTVLLGQYYPNSPNTPMTQWVVARPADTGAVGSQIGADTSVTISTTTTYLVGKIEFNTSGSNDSIWFWLNPSSSTDLQSNTGYNGSLINQIDVGNMGSFDAYTTSSFTFDEVRISTMATDMFGAIPEPSTYAALAGLAALGFAALRRRHRKPL